MHAAERDERRTVATLLLAGATTGAASADGMTASLLARGWRHRALVSMLDGHPSGRLRPGDLHRVGVHRLDLDPGHGGGPPHTPANSSPARSGPKAPPVPGTSAGSRPKDAPIPRATARNDPGDVPTTSTTAPNGPPVPRATARSGPEEVPIVRTTVRIAPIGVRLAGDPRMFQLLAAVIDVVLESLGDDEWDLRMTAGAGAARAVAARLRDGAVSVAGASWHRLDASADELAVIRAALADLAQGHRHVMPPGVSRLEIADLLDDIDRART